MYYKHYYNKLFNAERYTDTYLDPEIDIYLVTWMNNYSGDTDIIQAFRDGELELAAMTALLRGSCFKSVEDSKSIVYYTAIAYCAFQEIDEYKGCNKVQYSILENIAAIMRMLSCVI